jgi:hypothetical protein
MPFIVSMIFSFVFLFQVRYFSSICFLNYVYLGAPFDFNEVRLLEEEENVC